ncbi:MAG: AAA family ATPase [Candidatus Pacearchaeota archaeon]|jgi:cellulose biosynthesis protein BcsQ
MKSKETKHPRIIAALTNKGGTGKSVIITGLASAWAMKGLNVCLIDLDKQGDSLQWFECTSNKEKTIYDLLLSNELPEIVLANAMDTTRKNLFHIMPDSRMDSYEGFLALLNTDTHLSEKLKILEKLDFLDIILIDCPAATKFVKNNVARYAHEIIIPTSLSSQDINGGITLMNSLNIELYKNMIYWIVPNKIRSTTQHKDTLTDLYKWYNEILSDTQRKHVKITPLIRNTQDIEFSGKYHKTVVESKKFYNPGKTDIKNVAEMILNGRND